MSELGGVDVGQAAAAAVTIASVLGAHFRTELRRRDELDSLRRQVTRLRRELERLSDVVDRWTHLP